MRKSGTYCVSGIDTDIGKTVATGILARSFLEHKIPTITQKLVQTGCEGMAEDIEAHREIMGIELLDVDISGLTCPFVFKVPCSPHLAARIENRLIDCDTIRAATAELQEQFDVILLEGAGGLSVPILEDFTFMDYLEEENMPLILVTSSRLGSINHTLNSLELASRRGIDVVGVIYNLFGDSDSRIVADSRQIFEKYLEKFGFNAEVIDMLPMEEYRQSNGDMIYPDFYSHLFNN